MSEQLIKYRIVWISLGLTACNETCEYAPKGTEFESKLFRAFVFKERDRLEFNALYIQDKQQAWVHIPATVILYLCEDSDGLFLLHIHITQSIERITSYMYIYTIQKK